MIAVIGIITSSILLNTRIHRPDVLLKQHATTLAKTMKLLLQEAIMNDQNYALSLGSGGYQVLVFDGESFRPSDERFFASLQKQYDYEDELMVDDRIIAIDNKQTPEPHILFLSSGEMSVIEWNIQDRENQLRVRLNSSLLGKIQIEGPAQTL